MNHSEHKKSIEKLRQDLRDFLNRENITLERAAKQIEVTSGTLSLFLNGKTTPHERTLYRIRRVIAGWE